jgi:hypothetical protein
MVKQHAGSNSSRQSRHGGQTVWMLNQLVLSNIKWTGCKSSDVAPFHGLFRTGLAEVDIDTYI